MTDRCGICGRVFSESVLNGNELPACSQQHSELFVHNVPDCVAKIASGAIEMYEEGYWLESVTKLPTCFFGQWVEKGDCDGCYKEVWYAK